MSTADRTNPSPPSHLVVVANRLPVQRVGTTWHTSPGGLVRAMLGVLRDRGGAWVGWDGVIDGDGDGGGGDHRGNDITASAGPGSGGSDHGELGPGVLRPGGSGHGGSTHDGSGDGGSTHDLAAAGREIHELAGVDLVRVPLSAHEFLHYYERIANGALWPLFHDAIRDSTFDAESWAVYREVNQRFAAAAASHAAPGATVWIHDYHLLLVPTMLRDLRPDVSIGFFLHIPFPPQELFMRMPWREELLHGVLGADLVGFQRNVGAENFVALAKRLVDAEHGDRDGDLLTLPDGRISCVGTFPISIDVDEIAALADAGGTAERAASIRRQLGNPATVFLGVDRLDYTKGIDLRLSSFGALLRTRAAPDDVGVDTPPDLVLVQIAVPGREGVESYVEERHVVEQLVGEVNGEHATIGHPVVHYIRRGLPLDQLVPLYLAADIMLVTPRRDGMNLVAKEFVAARRDDTGVLILSEFAGASDELTEAIVVNPHDPDAIVGAMQQAMDMAPDEIARHMAAMRAVVVSRDVHEWAKSFLRTLASRGAIGTEVGHG